VLLNMRRLGIGKPNWL